MFERSMSYWQRYREKIWGSGVGFRIIFRMVTIRFGLGQFIYWFNNGLLGGEKRVENFHGYGQLFVDHFEDTVVAMFHSLGTELEIFRV